MLGGDVTLSTGKRASSASIDLADPRLELLNSLPLPTRDTKIPMDVWGGFSLNPKRIFSGWVSQLSGTDAPGRISVIATDKLKGARRKQRSRALAETSIEQLAKGIAKSMGVALDTSNADLTELRALGRVIQHGESDYELLERLCSSVGHTVFADADALRIIDEGWDMDGEFILELRRGVNIRGDVRFTVTERTRLNTRHITDYTGEVISAADEYEQELAVVELARTGVSSVDEDAPSYSSQATAWAKKSLANARKVFECSIETEFEELVKPGGVVALRGYGQRFSGLWRVDQVRHRLGGVSTTTLELYNGGTD